jgi:hypothetical protein
LDLARAAAGVAGFGGGAVRGSRALALGAQDRGVDRDGRLHAEGGLLEGELEAQDGVGAGAAARAGAAAASHASAAEEGVHDVLEAHEGGAAGAAGASAAARGQGVAAHVDDLALLGVGEDLEGGVDVLELLLRLGRGVHVGVELTRQLAVRLLEVVRSGVALNAQYLVVVLGHVCSRCHRPSKSNMVSSSRVSR